MSSTRKPYNDVVGYIASRKCYAPCGGHIVLYDREKGYECDADERWIVQHEPSGVHVAIRTHDHAYHAMKTAATIPDEVLGVELEDLFPPEFQLPDFDE